MPSPPSVWLILHDIVIAVLAIALYRLLTAKRRSMPGFLDDTGYGGTTKVDLGKGYWAEVKNCLSTAEKEWVDNLLGGKQKVDVGPQRQFAELDIGGSRIEMVVQSLVDWNITDPDGTVWPLDAGGKFAGRGNENPYPPGCPRRLSVARLPSPARDQIWAKCDELDNPRQGREAADFPGPDVVGDQDGNAGTAGAAPVPDGAGAVEAAGPDPQ